MPAVNNGNTSSWSSKTLVVFCPTIRTDSNSPAPERSAGKTTKSPSTIPCHGGIDALLILGGLSKSTKYQRTPKLSSLAVGLLEKKWMDAGAEDGAVILSNCLWRGGTS